MAFTAPVPSSPLWLDDGATTHVHSGGGSATYFGKVAGVSAVFDTGDFSEAWRGVGVFEADILNRGGVPASVIITFEGSSSADFSGHVQGLASWVLTVANQQTPVEIDTLYDEVRYRYIRMALNIAGTSAEVRLKAYVKPIQGVPSITAAEYLTTTAIMGRNLRNATVALRNWMTGVVNGGDYGDGRYPLQDGLGNTVYMKCPAQLEAEGKPRTPFQYGAIGSRGLPWGAWPSRKASDFFETLEDCRVVYPFALSLHQEMDFLGHQAWSDAGGTGEIKEQWEFKMCNTNPASWVPWVHVAGNADLHCGFSGYHWEDMGILADNTEFMPNSNFATGAGWVNATQYPANEIIPVTFGGGQAVAFDPSTPMAEKGRFYQFGKKQKLQPGYYTAEIVFEAELGQSYGFPPPLNNNQPAWAGIGWNSAGPGSGSSVIKGGADFQAQLMSKIFTPGRHGFSGKFDFIVTEETEDWLTFGGGGYVSFYITYFGIRKWLPNTAIFCTRDGDEHRPDAKHHYNVPMGINDAYFWGPVAAENAPTCLRWKSFVNIDGNLVIPKNIYIDGFGRQVLMGDGTYLLQFHNVNGNFGWIAIEFEGGRNAGENNRFHGGGFGNSRRAIIRNPFPSQMTFHSTSLDYGIQTCIDMAGRIETFGVHIEQNVPTDVNKPLFDLIDGGSFIMHGGSFLGAGPVFSSPCAPVRTNNSKCTFKMFGTEPYHLGSDPNGPGKGAVMSGPGQILISLPTNKGNPNIGPVCLSYATAMDVLGGAGHFEPVAGTPFIDGMGGKLGGNDLIGGAYIADADLIESDEFIDQWENSRIKAEVILAADGKRSLKIEKLAPYGLGNGGRIQIFIPAERARGILGKFEVKLPAAFVPGADPTKPATLYFRRFWAQILEFDLLNRPIVARRWTFAGENNFTLDGLAGGAFEERYLSTLYLGDGSTDPESGIAAGAPQNATHLGILLDHEAIPALSYELRGLIANLC